MNEHRKKVREIVELDVKRPVVITRGAIIAKLPNQRPKSSNA